ncbi:hypothetical protein R0J91_17540, partial [Micrococcus sp. SIMBA_131]
ANRIKITNGHHNKLLNLGFTEAEIYNIDQEEYDRNKDMEGRVTGKDTKYYKIIETLAHDDQNEELPDSSAASISSKDSQNVVDVETI